MATVNTFLASYPEFAQAETESPGLIQTKLNEATSETNATVMGVRTERAILVKAAILLLRSPWARSLRLENQDMLTAWERELREMQCAATVGLRVF